MAINMLVFDYRNTETDFFRTTDLSNFNIKFFEESLNSDTIQNISQEDKDNAMVISVFINSEITEDIINQFKNLRIISSRSTGVDHINSRACLARNISLINVMDYGSTAVAQFTFGLILALVRNIVIAADTLKGFEKNDLPLIGRDLSGLTLGVIGTGAIGGAVCKIAQAFDMKILAYDLIIKQELVEKYGVKYATFEDLLQNADIITLHTPYTGDNKNMISYTQFNMMKPNSYLINTSRGEIIDVKALKETLDKNLLKGAALDVVNCEEYSLKCENFSQSLENIKLECIEDVKIIREITKYPNVIVTPHIAYETQYAIDYILQKTFDGVIDTIKGGTKYRVI